MKIKVLKEDISRPVDLSYIIENLTSQIYDATEAAPDAEVITFLFNKVQFKEYLNFYTFKDIVRMIKTKLHNDYGLEAKVELYGSEYIQVKVRG